MKRLPFILFVAMLFASCGAADRFAVVEAANPVFNALTSVHGRAVIENSSRRDLVLENAFLTFYYKSREVATARLLLPVGIPAEAVTGIRYDLKLESESLSNLQTLQNRMQTNPSQVSVDITAHVRYGNIRRKVTMDGVPYTGIIVNFEQ